MRSSAEGPGSPAMPRSPAATCPPTIRFPLGLPGFPKARLFTLQETGSCPAPFLAMRSSEDPSLQFLVLPCADDALPIDRVELEAACDLHGLTMARVVVLLIVGGQPDGANASGQGLSVNRRAPILLDTGRAIGIQHVLDNPAYAVRSPLALAA